MPLTTLVYDDFYTDPMEVRRRALACDYPERGPDDNYPGRNSRQRLFIKDLDNIISQLVGESVVGSPIGAHGCFRIAMAADDVDRRYNVHIDPLMYWSAILYLTLPEHCCGGTEFYRHKETGTDHAAIYPEELAKAGVKSFGEAGDPIIQRDSKDLSKWEHLMTVPMRFNRLVLLRPWLWHTAGKSFGDSPQNCRLIQLFFFVPAPARAPAG